MTRLCGGKNRLSGLGPPLFTGALAAGLLETAGVLARGAGFGADLLGVLGAVFTAVLPGTDLAASGFLAPDLTKVLAAGVVLAALGDLDLAEVDAVFLTAGLATGLPPAFGGAVLLPVAFFAPAATRVWDATAPALPRTGLVGGLALVGDDVVIDLAGLAFT
jgi:hypothetical protein